MRNPYQERDYSYGTAMFTVRNAIGLTQEGLANYLGISRQAVGKWEAGRIYPKAEHLKEVIALGVEHQAFAKGCEAEEIRALWKRARQKLPLDERWLSTLLSGQPYPQPHVQEVSLEETKCLVPVTTQDEPDEHAPPIIQNLPFLPNPFFTGRESELLLISELFLKNDRIAISQPLSVSGLGGIGKTQLALEYAHRSYPSIYRCVFWVNAADKATLEASYLTLAYLLKLPEEKDREVDCIVQAVKLWLEQYYHWLLILDNADDLELARSFLPTKPRGHILLTTRSQIVGPLATLIQVEALSPEVGLLFLLRRSGVLPPGAEPESIEACTRHAAGEVVEMLSGHLLALDQAGAYIEETRDPEFCATSVVFTAYRQIYQQQSHLLLKRRGALGGEHPDSVAQTIEISMQKACQLHPNCRDVLAFCSLLHPNAIPEELLRQEAALNLDLYPFDEVIAALRRYSLVKRESGKQLLSLHRLVQSVIRESMNAQQLRLWTAWVVRAVNATFPEGAAFEQWSQCERLLSHALVCWTWIEREAIVTPQAASLLHKAGTYLRERGQYTQALPLLQRALTIREQCLGTEHPQTAISLNALAEVYRRQSQLSLAEPLYQRALIIQEQHVGEIHPDTAKTLNNLALLCSAQSRYDQAELLCHRAIAIHEQHPGAEHATTATNLSNLAILYQEQGRYQEAELLFLRALAIREQSLGASHPDTALSLNNLALLYLQQGRYQQAEPLFLRALALYEHSLGVSHPDTVLTLSNLALLYQKQGRYQEAKPLFLQALALYEQSLGVEHTDTARTLNNLACFYREQGKYEQAEPLVKQALVIYEQRLGTEHPRTTHPLHELAEVYRGQGKYEQAEPLYQRALTICEQYLGPDHLLTSDSLHGLAELYRQQGKYEQAETFYQRALSIYEKRLGPTHPLTEASRKDYDAFLHISRN